MKLVVVSDTHGHHRSLDTSTWEGDVLIHCGDFLNGVNPPSSLLRDLDDWFGSLRFERILVVGGNHDFEAELKMSFGQRVFQNAKLLHDRACEHRGVRFYGSSWVPNLAGWAFHASERELAKRWKAIPEQTDVLLTHTPPFSILDQPFGAEVHLGCPLLSEHVERVQPQLHCFGHIHASYGQHEHNGTLFINAALATGEFPFRLDKQPVIIEI